MVRDTGAIVIACGCREGLGSEEYCRMVRQGRSPDEFFAHCCKPENFAMDQWCLQTTCQALAHARQIYVYAPRLGHEDRKALEKMGFLLTEDLQATVDSLLPDAGSVVAVPQGPYVVGLVREGDCPGP
jgi:nickel-dependent lactate racemase